MIPLIGGAIGLFAATVNAVGIGATAGMGFYAILELLKRR